MQGLRGPEVAAASPVLSPFAVIRIAPPHSECSWFAEWRSWQKLLESRLLALAVESAGGVWFGRLHLDSMHGGTGGRGELPAFLFILVDHLLDN